MTSVSRDNSVLRTVEINDADVAIGDSIPIFGRYVENNKVTHISDDGIIYTPITSFVMTGDTIIVFREA